MFKPIEFPGFLCKARFPPGGEFFIHLKCSPLSQTILNRRKSQQSLFVFFCVIYQINPVEDARPKYA